MRVSYDPQTFLRQRSGGISRLFTDLIKEFDTDPSLGVEVSLPFKASNNVYLANELSGRGLKSMPNWIPRGALYAPWWVRGAKVHQGLEIVHRTYYSQRFLGAPKHVKQVVTIHDMIPELFADSEYFTATHLAKRNYVKECDLVICISESTRKDLKEIYGDLSNNTVVIHNSVDASFGQLSEPLDNLPVEYLLYVGARKGYKDFSLLPKALELLRDGERFEIPLVVVGPKFTAIEIEEIRNRGLLKSIINVQLSDEDLKRAYSHSALLVQTSRYEGFGLTPLEGMASGVPVIAANSSSMPEVGGDVVQYFNPGDHEDLARLLVSVLTNNSLRSDLGNRGRIRALEFTTHTMAMKTQQAYSHLLYGEL